MRGWPFTELILTLFCTLLLAWPMVRLTRSYATLEHPAISGLPADENTLAGTEAWAEIRCSHPLRHLRLLQGETSLLQIKAAQNGDGDFRLHLTDGHAQLTLETEVAEEVDQAWVEVTLEPDHLPARKQGAWIAGGKQSLQLDFSWGDHP